MEERKGLKSETSSDENRMDGIDGMDIDIDADGIEIPKKKSPRDHLDLPSGHQYKESASLTVDGSVESASAAGTIIIHDIEDEAIEAQSSAPAVSLCFQSPPP